MSLFSTISIQDRVSFAKNLSIMLRSGIAINDALATLGEQSSNKRFTEILESIGQDIENGTSLSKAFSKQTKIFGVIFVSMIKAGEQSGTLQGNLQFLAEWLSRSSDLRNEVNAATLYPKLVFGASLLLGGGLAVFILPMLVPLFNGLSIKLPWITRTLLALSVFVQHFWLLTIVAVFSIYGGFKYINRIFLVRRFFHGMYLGFPLIGSLLKHYQLALITQLFSTLLKSGLSLNESVDIVSQAATNIHYTAALLKIKNSVEKGTTLSNSMIAFPNLFPKIIINIISIGEQSGTLTNSFDYLSEFYTKEVNIETKRLPTIIEPLLLVFIAVIVGFIALSIIMPIYELTGSISR